MPLEDWIQHCKVARFLYDWQTIFAGFLALAAAVVTVVETRRIANRQIAASAEEADRQIAASREEADRVIAAARAQTEATFKQTETTVRLEQDRVASEATAFAAMVEAATSRVLAEAAWARETYPNLLTPQKAGASPEALAVRKCITKGAFAELRAACVRRGGLLTFNILDLEREIDSFALQCEDRQTNEGAIIRMGKHAGLGEQLARIETMANDLHLKSCDP
jgi:hypothetical protein